MGRQLNTLCRLAVIQYWISRLEQWCLLHFWYALLCRYFGHVVPSPVKKYWASMGHIKRGFLKNITIGLLITLILHGLHAAGFLRNNLRWALDWTMALNAGTQFASDAASPGQEHPYLFVNIDEQLYQKWGEPLFTPRDSIAALLRNAMEGGAKLVIVDVDLTRPSPAPREDAALHDFLAGLRSVPPEERPPVILVKSMHLVGEGADARWHFRGSFLDSLVAETPGLYWASPMFTVDDDQVIRYWRLAECSPTSQGPEALPSVQLLAYALTTHGDAPGTNLADALRGQLEKARGLCAQDESAHDNAAASLVIGTLSFPLSEQTLENRILYSIKPNTPSPTLSGDRTGRPAFLTLPAGALLGPDSGRNLREILRDGIVIIGGSYNDSGDIHATPIGPMPGALVILNAIRSLSLYGIAHEPSLWATLAIETALILVMSGSFLLFHTFGGMLLSGLCIICFLVPASIALFRHGVWLDFALPLIAVQLHHMAEEFEKKREALEKEPGD